MQTGPPTQISDTARRDHCVAVFRVVVAGRYPVCRVN